MTQTNLCKRCNGKGYYLIGKDEIACDRCFGDLGPGKKYYVEFAVNDYYAAELGLKRLEELVSRELEYRSLQIWRKFIHGDEGNYMISKRTESWSDPSDSQLHWRLHVRVMSVREMNYTIATIPEFEYVNYQGQLEWVCNWCGVVNAKKATFCGELHTHTTGCGHPKSKEQTH